MNSIQTIFALDIIAVSSPRLLMPASGSSTTYLQNIELDKVERHERPFPIADVINDQHQRSRDDSDGKNCQHHETGWVVGLHQMHHAKIDPQDGIRWSKEDPQSGQAQCQSSARVLGRRRFVGLLTDGILLFPQIRVSTIVVPRAGFQILPRSPTASRPAQLWCTASPPSSRTAGPWCRR